MNINTHLEGAGVKYNCLHNPNPNAELVPFTAYDDDGNPFTDYMEVTPEPLWKQGGQREISHFSFAHNQRRESGNEGQVAITEVDELKARLTALESQQASTVTIQTANTTQALKNDGTINGPVYQVAINNFDRTGTTDTTEKVVQAIQQKQEEKEPKKKKGWFG